MKTKAMTADAVRTEVLYHLGALRLGYTLALSELAHKLAIIAGRDGRYYGPSLANYKTLRAVLLDLRKANQIVHDRKARGWRLA